MYSLWGHNLTWNDFNRKLKDALSAIIRSSTLKIVHLSGVEVPIRLFQGVHLTQLELDSVSSRLLTLPASDEVAKIAIDQLVWSYMLERDQPVRRMSFSISA